MILIRQNVTLYGIILNDITARLTLYEVTLYEVTLYEVTLYDM